MRTLRKATFACVFILLTFCQCTNRSESQIREIIAQFYAKHAMFREVNQQLLSVELGEMVSKAREFEKRDAEKVKNSDFPTDKPHLIEGDIFTSLYEGQDSFMITDIKIEDKQAMALVEFRNSAYSQKWNDQVVLLNENGWKIDNVIFHEGRNGASTKDVLRAFIQLEIKN